SNGTGSPGRSNKRAGKFGRRSARPAGARGFAWRRWAGSVRRGWRVHRGGPGVADESSFADLIGRVRAGDGRAAAELVRRYEPAVRVAVRVRLTDPGLRRVLDSMDVCQSVF